MFHVSSDKETKFV